MQGMSPWLILDVSLMMMTICCGYICTLACYLTLVGAWMNQNLWDCKSLSSWEISTSPSLYNMVVEDKEAWNLSTYPLTISIYQISFVIEFMIVKLDTHVLFFARLTHVGKWTQTTSGAPNHWWATSTLSIPHKFNYMIKFNTTTQGMLFHLREVLYTPSHGSKQLNKMWIHQNA